MLPGKDDDNYLRKKYFMGISDRLSELNKEKAEANLKEGEKFLADNKTRPGVTETEKRTSV
jgi:hypothetical protein